MRLITKSSKSLKQRYREIINRRAFHPELLPNRQSISNKGSVDRAPAMSTLTNGKSTVNDTIDQLTADEQDRQVYEKKLQDLRSFKIREFNGPDERP